MSELTEWFPPEIKPVHKGYYEATTIPIAVDKHEHVSPIFMWDGEFWMHRNGYRAIYQYRHWRGLRRKP